MMSENDRIGEIYLPSGKGVGVGRFEVILDDLKSHKVQIGDIITAVTTEGEYIGVVTEMRTVGLDSDPVTVKKKRSSHNEFEEVIVAEAQVIFSEKIRSVKKGYARMSTIDEVKHATGFSKMRWPIAAGLIQINEHQSAPIYFDGHTLLGPEAAHLNVGGLSGQAAKTSYLTFLLASSFASSSETEQVAALVFNVKGEDLVWLDKEPAEGYELSIEDEAQYRNLGVKPEPFRDVVVYSPAVPGQPYVTQSRRQDSKPIKWDLIDIWPYLRHFLGSIIYEDEKIASFLADYYTKVIQNPDPQKRVDTFSKLDAWFNYILHSEDDNSTPYLWGTHHRATLWRARRMLMGIVTRSNGLVTLESSLVDEDIPVKKWRNNQIVVVDISGLTLDVQSVVIARTIERVLKTSENNTLGVDHLIVVADELNAFAPSSGSDMQVVRKTLQKISTQGRYAGLSLWGAAQKLSRIDELIRDNAASRALGRNSDGELSTTTYSKLPKGLLERVVALPRGYMSLSHYTFRTEMIVQFPKPAWSMGRTNSNYTDKKILQSITDNATDRLLEGINESLVNEIISTSVDEQEAITKLSRARIPDMKKTALHTPYIFNEQNPFDIS